MKICMVGLGSIGQRHLRNISSLLKKQGEEFTFDALRGKGVPLPQNERELLRQEYFSIDELQNDYDAAFICNPTSLHYEAIKTMAGRTRHMFIEKPVFDSAEYDIDKLGLRSDGVYYVACPLRYTSVLQWAKQYVNEKRVFAARAICSTYLPGWRPGADYRDTYSAHRDMGGGVSIDLIHEWDYLGWLFGLPERVLNLQGKYSGLELDSDDLSLYIARYADKLVSLHLDYFGRQERRELELYTDDETVVCDIRRQEVRLLREGRTISMTEARDAYQMRELEAFFSMVRGEAENSNPLELAVRILGIGKGGYAG